MPHPLRPKVARRAARSALLDLLARRGFALMRHAEFDEAASIFSDARAVLDTLATEGLRAGRRR